ncbi:MAG: DNA repair protein RecN [Bacteroidales bacterium]|nr:DNA repair protein RecN [Bacteroidales bacterium]
MLKSLFIQNYVLIDKARVEFEQGLNVITGETGAGKSILLGALSLILGKRADMKALLDKDVKCIVEGQFMTHDIRIREWFEKYDLDFWNEYTLIRREINPEGKSRAFINDTPANLNMLHELGSALVDIHSQNSMQSLNDPDFQLSVLDTYAGIQELSAGYGKEYKKFRAISDELNSLIEKEKKQQSDRDYYRFLFDEIEHENLAPDEDGLLSDELKWLKNAVENKKNLLTAGEILDNQIETALNAVREKIHAIARHSDKFEQLAQRINNDYIDLKDISSEIAAASENINYNPERVAAIEERLDAINRLLHKHRLASAKEILLFKDELDKKLADMDTLEGEIQQKEKEFAEQKNRIIDLAGVLTKKRSSVLPAFAGEVEAKLNGLGMPKAVFEVDHKIASEPGRHGTDHISFFFNANNMGESRELSKTASGGELSRLMLSIKSLVSGKNNFPTIILDEIDMGVSGKIADRVGELLKTLAGGMQVIAITHLPQIAGKGNSHLFVYKESEGNISRSKFRNLTLKERVEEIAKMVSGENISGASLETARNLIGKNSDKQ